ncbi:YceK/YidQ family lipoprotein [Ewingella americana]|uniref:YceK/YidQ family lipoprotein n=1 Tax=Ewingella americana TaxID=41202 RepID=A0A502G1G0_9GAMM|nr:YceK/YidQ family lipoprotein [Ewingella americana]TPG55605.1 YceK/YidQ family lipoprotein [Ewingella americana]
MMKTVLLPLVTGCVFLSASGCSSVMTHTGGHQGYYPGARADVDMMASDDTSWAMTPLLIIDLPFSALLDTLLLPYDYFRQGKENTRDRIKASEEHNLALSNGVDIDHVPPMSATTHSQKSSTHKK